MFQIKAFAQSCIYQIFSNTLSALFLNKRKSIYKCDTKPYFWRAAPIASFRCFFLHFSMFLLKKLLTSGVRHSSDCAALLKASDDVWSKNWRFLKYICRSWIHTQTSLSRNFYWLKKCFVKGQIKKGEYWTNILKSLSFFKMSVNLCDSIHF